MVIANSDWEQGSYLIPFFEDGVHEQLEPRLHKRGFFVQLFHPR